MSSSPSLSGFRPVGWAGESVNITLTGVPSTNSLSFSLDGSSISVQPQWEDDGTVTVLVPTGDASSAVVKLLDVDLGDGNLYTVNVTVLPQTAPPAFVEDPAWLEMFEGGAKGWNWTGWEFDTLEGLIAAYGTHGKQRFTRESGIVAAAVGTGTHTLRSPPIQLDGEGDYELRFASHYNTTGRPEAQRAVVSVSYGNASAEVQLLALNDTQESILHRAKLNPPSDTATATFIFTLDGGDDLSYWLIDDVQIVHPLSTTTDAPLEVIDIISDIQGIGQNSQMADSLLPGLRKLQKATTLVMNGDLVNDDDTESWSSFMTAFNSTDPYEYYQNVISVAGNHEMYDSDDASDSEAHINNFLMNTGMAAYHGDQGRGLWGEHITAAGTPLIWMASEQYNYGPSAGLPPYFQMSDTQFLYLAERLAYWRKNNRPVLFFSHYPLPYSVSGTWDTIESETFGEDALRFKYLLAANPHALLITSHTHYDIAANDQNVDYRPLVGNNNTVTTFNTGATLNWFAIGPEDYTYDWIGDGSPTGLQAEVYADRIRVKAYRFWDLSTEGTLMQERDVGSPLNPIWVSHAVMVNGTSSQAEVGSGAKGRVGAAWGWVVIVAIVTFVSI